MTIIFSKRDDTLFLRNIWKGLDNVKVVEVDKYAKNNINRKKELNQIYERGLASLGFKKSFSKTPFIYYRL